MGAPVPTAGAPHQPAKGDLAGTRAVVCESEGVLALQLMDACSRHGATIVGAARDGPEAVSVVLRERPGLVLLDLELARLDGLEAIRRILAQWPTCIIATDCTNGEARVKATFDAGACGYLLKPFSSEHLVPLIHHALEQYALGQAVDRRRAAVRPQFEPQPPRHPKTV